MPSSNKKKSFVDRETSKKNHPVQKNRPIEATRPSDSHMDLPEKKKSFVDREVSKSGHLIHKLKAKDSTGRWAYYFVLIEPPKEKRFFGAIGGEGMINLEDYGKVIASCYGEEPSQEIKNYLKEKYGFNV